MGHNIMTTALQKGHDVAFTYKNPDTDVERLLRDASQTAPDQQCRAYHLDVRNGEEVKQVAEQVEHDFEALDAVIYNSGINRDNLMFNMSDEEWSDVIQTNLTGAFYVMREFLPHFLALGRGTFISISSISKEGASGQANYSASKAGLIGLSGTLAKEYGAKGITSNVIAAGLFETDMTRASCTEEARATWLKYCPLKRIGRLRRRFPSWSCF